MHFSQDHEYLFETDRQKVYHFVLNVMYIFADFFFHEITAIILKNTFPNIHIEIEITEKYNYIYIFTLI